MRFSRSVPPGLWTPLLTFERPVANCGAPLSWTAEGGAIGLIRLRARVLAMMAVVLAPLMPAFGIIACFLSMRLQARVRLAFR